MVSTGIEINLAQFIINKMMKVLKDKEKETKGKQKLALHPQVYVLYITIITHYVKTLGTLNARYEVIPLAVTYYVASITKIGYKDNNSNGIFMKVKGASGENDVALKSETQGQYGHFIH